MAEGGSKVWVVIGVVAGIMVLLCCGGGAVLLLVGGKQAQQFANMTEAEREAAMGAVAGSALDGRDAVAEDFLVALRDEGVDAAYAYTSPHFRKAVSKEDLTKVQRGIESVMGAYESKRIKTFTINARFGTNVSGTVLTLYYDSVFEKGEGTITFKLHEQPSGAFEVLEYRVNSPLLMEKLAEEDE